MEGGSCAWVYTDFLRCFKVHVNQVVPLSSLFRVSCSTIVFAQHESLLPCPRRCAFPILQRIPINMDGARGATILSFNGAQTCQWPLGRHMDGNATADRVH